MQQVTTEGEAEQLRSLQVEKLVEKGSLLNVVKEATI